MCYEMKVSNWPCFSVFVCLNCHISFLPFLFRFFVVDAEYVCVCV